MSDAPALTKRQKKSARFRSKQRESNTSTSPPVSSDVAHGDEAPAQTTAPASSQSELETAPGTEAQDLSAAPANDTADVTAAKTVPNIKKRSKKAAKAAAVAPTATKTTFDQDGEAQSVTTAPPAPTTQDTKNPGTKYIVFVGNMSFDVTAEMLAQHMSSTCGETPSVRLLTKKGDPAALASLSMSKRKSIAKGKAKDPSAPVSRGCAFVEFSNASALQKALRFHHTMYQGRQINVELTAGGGGHSQRRKDKIKAKNAELDKERQKLHDKYIKPENEAHKRKQADKAADAPAPTPAWSKSDRPLKRPKFASGANAVKMG